MLTHWMLAAGHLLALVVGFWAVLARGTAFRRLADGVGEVAQQHIETTVGEVGKRCESVADAHLRAGIVEGGIHERKHLA